MLEFFLPTFFFLSFFLSKLVSSYTKMCMVSLLLLRLLERCYLLKEKERKLYPKKASSKFGGLFITTQFFGTFSKSKSCTSLQSIVFRNFLENLLGKIFRFPDSNHKHDNDYPTCIEPS